MEKRKRNIVIGMTSLLLATLILLGLTYAYYKTKIVGNTSDKSVSVVSKNLSVTYQNESAEISATGIEPGYSATKTFEVKNTGSETVEYSVMLDNVTNTFTRTEDWTYTISENGTELKSGTLPNSTSYILYSESIDAGATKSYTLKIDYANSTEDQSDDMGASLSFRINISDDLGTTLTSASEGTLLYAINRDNVVSEPLTEFGGQQPYHYEEGTWGTETLTENISEKKRNNYVLYGTGYTIDETTGKYTLTGVTTTTDTYANSYSELEGKYVNDYWYYSFFGETKEDVLQKNITDLSNIYKIVKVTSTSIELITLSEGKKVYLSEELLAPTEDDYGTSFYFRGDVKNNYVNYGESCWKIVRVQGDGTIKLVLSNGSFKCNSDAYLYGSGEAAFIADSTYKADSTFIANDFLFETSDIPNVLNNWLTSKNLDTTKLVDAAWCNDTSLTNITYFNGTFDIVDKEDAENTYMYYGASRRKKNPTLKCNIKGMDGTTGIEANAQKYIGKAGLLTADEVIFAGYSNYLSENASVGDEYWTMSPSWSWNSSQSRMYMVDSDGELYDSSNIDINVSASVRPAIVLNANVTISSGNGTVDNPYVIS